MVPKEDNIKFGPWLNIEQIEAELQELAGEHRVRVKRDDRLDVAVSIRETDECFDITFNPRRFKSPKKLEELLAMCREAITHHMRI